ncbi:MAG: hypothetical protein M0Z36_03960 [Thermaerobacter sp.]|nr:hypothetical protein [Thermaerobacter sp.]
MGLDFSHCDASWSYTNFHEFRSELAEMVGIDLSTMEGFGGTRSFDELHDDIKPLLDLSDCDGELSPDDCQRVANRLEELIAKAGEEWHHRSKGLLLVEGLRDAASHREHFLFR